MFQSCKCKYCTTYNGFPILWNTEDRVWFEIPKNASTSLKRKYFGNTFLRHASQYDKYLVREYSDIVPIIIWRDPVDRFISLIKHYCADTGARYTKRLVPFGNRKGVDVRSMDIRERMQFLIEHLDQLTTVEEVHHFYPQTHFVDTTNFSKFQFVHISEVSAVFDVPVSNKTIVESNIPVTKSQQLLIEHIYRTDYEFLKEVM